MCGLAAFFEPHRPFSTRLLDAVDGDLFHRGPDSGGRVNEPGAAMVFRRLAIMDPESRSDQPFKDDDGAVALVFNGEIYNFTDLRSQLEERGHRFTTRGDTETILRAYKEWGAAAFEKLIGMFAICLIDHRNGQAFAVRDPLGIKPLYWLRQGKLNAFASEARPLHRLKKASIDTDALQELLTFGWASGNLSNYDGITRVTPGTILTVSLDDGSVKERRYWDVLDTIEQGQPKSDDAIDEALQDSVKAHLMSDVGYSLQLSGGVDSSLVAAMAAADDGRKVQSFSLGLDGHAFDESPYQDMVVNRYGLDHHCMQIDGDAYAEGLPRAITHMEGPTPHGGCVGLMLLCERLRSQSKVVLTGEGADELFGGYQRYANWRKTDFQERLSNALPAFMTPDVWPFKGMNRLRGLDAAAFAPVYHDFRSVAAIFPELVPSPGARGAASARFNDFRSRLFAVDQTAYLESLLVRQDKMSMAASVESRVPFVHAPLYSMVNGTPHDDRCPGGETKPILKRIAERYLPKDLIYRRKIGLWLPYSEWFANPDGAGRYLEWLSAADSRLAAYADRRKYDDYLARLRHGGRREGIILQRLVELEVWLRDVDERSRAYLGD